MSEWVIDWVDVGIIFGISIIGYSAFYLLNLRDTIDMFLIGSISGTLITSRILRRHIEKILIEEDIN